MKKYTLILIALALVCTSAFASISLTAGLGFGGYIDPRDYNKLYKGEEYFGEQHFVYDAGPAAFVGFDYVNENGLTVYDDLAFNLTTIDNGFKHNELESKEFVTVTEYAGIGYSVDKGKYTLMAGAGIEFKAAVNGLDKACPDIDEDLYFMTIGFGGRFKGSYNVNEKWAVSAQLNGSFDFKVISNLADKEVVGEEIFAKVYGDARFFSGNLLIGATYKF